MSIKTVKLPIIVTRTDAESYENTFLPFLRFADTVEMRVFNLDTLWIREAKDYLIQFVSRGGKLKFIVSLDVDREMKDHLLLHHEAKAEEIVKQYILDPFKRELPYHEQWQVKYLSYLIANSLLEIKVTIPKPGGYRHNRLVFVEEDKDIVCFRGAFFPESVEKTAGEAIDVFVSWDQRDSLRIAKYKEQFDDEWRGYDDHVWTISLSEALRQEFVLMQDEYNPYKYLLLNKTKYKLRNFQQDAIDKLEAAKWRGMFVVPVGTGKIMSSTFALDQYIVMYPRTVALIVALNWHQMQEWEKTITSKYPEKQVFRITTEAELEETEIAELIRLKLKDDFIFMLTTYKFFSTQAFQNALHKNKNYTFYLFDEYQLLCRDEIRDNVSFPDDSARIGLSSLGNNWLGEADREYLNSIFTGEIVNYPIKDQLGKTLNEYDYHVFLSELIVSEFSEFRQLTSLATRHANIPKEQAEYLLQRERVVEKAYNKLQDFLVHLANLPKKKAIVYVDRNQLDQTKTEIEFHYHLKVEVLIQELPLDKRNRLFRAFQTGQIDLLVTHDAFDEGVENLNPVAIYLLSSPTIPRVFFKRRDRILYEKTKSHPAIYDYVTIPPSHCEHDHMQFEVIKRELPRIAELSRLARKSHIEELTHYLEKLKLTNLLLASEPADLNQDIYVKAENLME